MELDYRKSKWGRIPREGMKIPSERLPDWHKWLFENDFWLGDFCSIEGVYHADMEKRKDGYWYILPPKVRR